MPVKQVVVPRRVEKQILKTPGRIQKRLVNSLLLIQKNPNIGLKLRGELSDYRKLRVGNYRVIYRHDRRGRSVVVVKVEHRLGVYK